MLSLTLTSATNRIRLVQLSLFMFFALFLLVSVQCPIGFSNLEKEKHLPKSQSYPEKKPAK